MQVKNVFASKNRTIARLCLPLNRLVKADSGKADWEQSE